MAFFAMRRSGHHAIINWMRNLFPDKYSILFFNTVGVLGNYFTDNKLYNPDTLMLQKKRHGGNKIKLLKKSETKSVFYNYEDIDINRLIPCTNPDMIDAHSKMIGKAERCYNILILRDPFNLFASRAVKKNTEIRIYRSAYGPIIKPFYTVLQKSDEQFLFIEMWKTYAREFLGLTNILDVGYRKKVCISYNRWFIDKEYRGQLCKTFGLSFSDRGLNEVVSDSSFNDWNYHGRAQDLEVLNRWEECKDSPMFKFLLRDKALNELSDEIFGKIVT